MSNIANSDAVNECFMIARFNDGLEFWENSLMCFQSAFSKF